MSIKLTSFGQYARKLRVDHGEFLRDMSESLGVTSNYLSAVERGKRNVPYAWVEKLEKAYDLNKEETDELTKAISDSRYYDRIDVSHLSFEDKILLGDMANNVSNWGDNQKDVLKDLMVEEGSSNE